MFFHLLLLWDTFKHWSCICAIVFLLIRWIEMRVIRQDRSDDIYGTQSSRACQRKGEHVKVVTLFSMVIASCARSQCLSSRNQQTYGTAFATWYQAWNFRVDGSDYWWCNRILAVGLFLREGQGDSMVRLLSSLLPIGRCLVSVNEHSLRQINCQV